MIKLLCGWGTYIPKRHRYTNTYHLQLFWGISEYRTPHVTMHGHYQPVWDISAPAHHIQHHHVVVCGGVGHLYPKKVVSGRWCSLVQQYGELGR